jgi:hypothetical protein
MTGIGIPVVASEPSRRVGTCKDRLQWEQQAAAVVAVAAHCNSFPQRSTTRYPALVETVL